MAHMHRYVSDVSFFQKHRPSSIIW